MKNLSRSFLKTALFILLGYSFIQAQVPYSFSAGSGTYTPLTGATQFLAWKASGSNVDDEGYSDSASSAPIGFTFNYFGSPFTQFQASTNGFIRLGTGLTNAISANNLAGLTRKIIAPLWDDLKVDSAEIDITYKLDGVSPNQVLTVEWKNVRWSYNSLLLNAEFQVQLLKMAEL